MIVITRMTVADCMKEIRKASDALDTLYKYKSGEMPGIADQHIEEIQKVIENYIACLSEKEL